MYQAIFEFVFLLIFKITETQCIDITFIRVPIICVLAYESLPSVNTCRHMFLFVHTILNRIVNISFLTIKNVIQDKYGCP